MNWKKVGLAFALLILLALSGFLIWALTPLGPMQEAEDALQSTDVVLVTDDNFISFKPKTTEPTVGLIFYPGGRVDPVSYAPLAQLIASQGYLVVIVPMTLNLAVFSVNRAEEVIDSYPDIDIWTMAGHSLGGAMATSFIHDHPDQITGLYLLASYATESTSLAGFDLVVLSIYGTEDAVLSEDMNQTMTYLPVTAQLVPIEGGNHAYFGYYGEQPGDGQATISREQQHNITASLITTSLNTL